MFGGDPNSITIFGQSAGGVSVSFHTLLPQSWPYFNRAIIQSGTALDPWVINSPDRMRNLTFDVANRTQCYKM